MASAVIIRPPSINRTPGDLDELVKVERELDARIKTFGQASEQFQPVVALLTIINDSGAWQWHVGEDGTTPIHKSFRAYVESFGWQQSVPRLYQLMTEYRKAQIDLLGTDGYIPVDGLNYQWEARTRSTGTSLVRFAETQTRALGRTVDNFETAAHNVFESDPGRDAAIGLADDLRIAVASVLSALQAINDAAAQQKAEAKAARKAAAAAAKGRPVDDDDDDSDDADDDDDDDALLDD